MRASALVAPPLAIPVARRRGRGANLRSECRIKRQAGWNLRKFKSASRRPPTANAWPQSSPTRNARFQFAAVAKQWQHLAKQIEKLESTYKRAAER